jgi:hypothetical protein
VNLYALTMALAVNQSCAKETISVEYKINRETGAVNSG